ncbi:MAG: hypothetical protein GYA20_00560 [Chloroflexi bacterium]|nr:hypothetical protein [Chloroflexota bacterium]
MLQKSRELLFAVLAMILITLAYLLAQTLYGATPRASSLFGHGLGVVGFVLMLMTETLYSLRKRTRLARWGQLSHWLEFHIFTGLVGPFMVLLHPGWQFKGLAGVLSLLTVLIVLSGVIGRYIYTAVPRTADGIEIDLAALEYQVAQIEAELQAGQPTDATQPAARRGFAGLPAAFGLATRNSEQRKALHLRDLRRERDRLARALRDRRSARRLLSLWHAVHIPLGLTLFLVAFVHIGATIYYAVLL